MLLWEEEPAGPHDPHGTCEHGASWQGDSGDVSRRGRGGLALNMGRGATGGNEPVYKGPLPVACGPEFCSPKLGLGHGTSSRKHSLPPSAERW